MLEAPNTIYDEFWSNKTSKYKVIFDYVSI